MPFANHEILLKLSPFVESSGPKLQLKMQERALDGCQMLWYMKTIKYITAP